MADTASRILESIARRQLSDYRAGTPGTFFATGSLDLDQSYAVQDLVASTRIAEGDTLAGYKVGCTGPRVRAQFGMDGPIRGCLFSSELRPNGARLAYGAFANLAIEGELAARLGEGGRIARIFPVIELHNFVFRGVRPGLPELVANNGIHAGAVLPEASVGGDLAAMGYLRIEINGRLVEEEPAAGVPGGPSGSLAWLEGHLKAYGRTLAPGQLILTGTPLSLIAVQPGDRVRVVAENLGHVDAFVTT